MNTEVIGEYIRDKRLLMGWTQEELAEAADITRKTVSIWENGKFISIKNENLDILRYEKQLLQRMRH